MLADLTAQALLFLPIGIIGVVRRGVWLMKKLIGLFYAPEPLHGDVGRVSVVAPVYKEDPVIFGLALDSWAQNGAYEIIAVIDEEDPYCADVFRQKAEEHGRDRFKLIMTDVPGKRPALAKGAEAAQGEIVALVDSDTIWEPDSLEGLSAPFIHPEVGGVTCRQRVLETKTLSQKLTDLMFDLRYEDEMRFLGRMDQGFSCLSGRTAVYRRTALIPLLPDMVNETYFGKPVISGEDKRLTYLLLAEGYKTRHQEEVIVYTTAPKSLFVLLQQKIRWTRNSWRADLRALGQPWIWKRPALMFYLADKCISAFTVLISPMVLGISIARGFWPLAAGILIWWMIGRSIKLMPYLSRKPGEFWIVPIYILFSLLMGLIRIYTLVTLNRQGWMTRGHATERPKAIHRIGRPALDAIMAASVLGGLFAIVMAYVGILT